MSDFYKDMPQDFRNAVEVIKQYCQNEDCTHECSGCPCSLSTIRSGDTVREKESQRQAMVDMCKENKITNRMLMDMYRLR